MPAVRTAMTVVRVDDSRCSFPIADPDGMLFEVNRARDSRIGLYSRFPHSRRQNQERGRHHRRHEIKPWILKIAAGLSTLSLTSPCMTRRHCCAISLTEQPSY